MSEITFKRLNESKKKPNDIRKEAQECLDGKAVITNLNDLSGQLFSSGTTLYLNPTERMYMSEIVKPGSSIATVLASGDFAINAVHLGANDLLTFDISKNQYYAAALKLKFLQNMSYEDFCTFYGNGETGLLSSQLYQKLKSISGVDYSLYPFFDYFMKIKEADENRLTDFMKRLTKNDPSLASQLEGHRLEETFRVIREVFGLDLTTAYTTIRGTLAMKTNGTYLESADSYKKTQEKMKAARMFHVTTDLARLKTQLEALKFAKKTGITSFDSIYLSNIPEYINGQSFARIVDQELMPLVKDDGVISYCCQSTDKKTVMRPEKELELLRKEVAYGNGMNPFDGFQKINSAEGYNKLQECYDVDLQEVDALADCNGQEAHDTYVFVRKK